MSFRAIQELIQLFEGTKEGSMGVLSDAKNLIQVRQGP